jgi:hypothetical protein
MQYGEMGSTRGAPSPQGEVSTPQTRPRVGRASVAFRYSLCLGLAAVSGVVACESSTTATGEIPPVVIAMSSTVAPYYSDPNLTIYWVESSVELPVRKGTGTEKNVTPYPSSPYLLTSDYQLQVNYTVSNLDNNENAVWITMNPWNQFVRYYPGVTIVSDDETEPNWPGMSTPTILPPQGKVQGTFTSDDMSDLATKLDIAMDIMVHKFSATDTNPLDNQATLLNHDFDTQFRVTDGDPLMAPYIPTVLAGMTGFDLGILSYNQVNVALEIEIQLIDNSNGKFIAPGEEGTPVGMPPQLLKVPGAVNM